MKKFNYKVLEINNVIEPIEGKFNCTYSSYTKDCIIENQFTGEIINVSNDINDINLKKIINFIDDHDCMVGDEFNIK
jgi:hypothetical protein